MNSTSIPSKDSIDGAATVERHRLMAELSIAHDGRYYHYDGYRYERLADAAAYAQLVRERQSQRTHPSASTQIDAVEPPSEADRQLMLELSISFENDRLVFEGYHYDRLIDAANHVRHRRQLRSKTP